MDDNNPKIKVEPMEQPPIDLHQIEILEEQKCLLFNRFCLKFCSQISILAVCIIYSLIELSKPNPSNKEFWASLLSFSIGVVVPSPENKHL